MTSRLRKCMFPMIDDKTFQHLHDEGICTVYDFIAQKPEKISKLCHISTKDVNSMRKVIINQYSAFPVNALQAYQNIVDAVVYPTSVVKINELLNGGVHAGEVTELIGPPAVGKTQLCLSIAASVASSGSKCSNVLYVNTNGGFSAEKVHFLIRQKLLHFTNVNKSMECIKSVEIHDIFTLLDFFDKLKHQLQKKVTNTVVRGNEDGFKPALGRYWSHVAHVRLLISKVDDKSNSPSIKVSLLKSNKLSAGSQEVIKSPNL